MLAQFYDFYQMLKGNGVLFCSTGPLNQQVIENLAATLRAKVELKEGNAILSTKVFSIFVEQVQNIIHYSQEKVVQEEPIHLEYTQGICMIGQEDGGYYIMSGNLIRNEDVERIEAKIKILQPMDAAALKAYYLAQRKQGPDAHSKGAGLGLIDMVRRGKTFEHRFHPVDAQHTFFSVRVSV
ncbi:MAG: SiaB family protein kinase [Magnetococcus sp. YQC-3]